jgi:hypothetical protein
MGCAAVRAARSEHLASLLGDEDARVLHKELDGQTQSPGAGVVEGLNAANGQQKLGAWAHGVPACDAGGLACSG